MIGFYIIDLRSIPNKASGSSARVLMTAQWSDSKNIFTPDSIIPIAYTSIWAVAQSRKAIRTCCGESGMLSVNNMMILRCCRRLHICWITHHKAGASGVVPDAWTTKGLLGRCSPCFSSGVTVSPKTLGNAVRAKLILGRVLRALPTSQCSCVQGWKTGGGKIICPAEWRFRPDEAAATHGLCWKKRGKKKRFLHKNIL